MAAILVRAKVSVFTARSIRLSPSLPNGSTWQKSRNKNKIGSSPNKRYRLTPLARHKSKDRSRYCHLWF